jgi:crotonobetaine/carnitine-CoA ligase
VSIELSGELLRGTGLDLGAYSLRYPAAERSMVRVLRDQAVKYPGRSWLVIDSTETLTFGAAWRDACRVAHALDRDGLSADAHVGLLLTNQRDFMPAFYGPQVRGGVTVPFNAELRGAPLATLIAHSQVRQLIVRADLLERLAALSGLAAVEQIVLVGAPSGKLASSLHGASIIAWNDWLDDVPDEHVWPVPAQSAPCLIQYTSGTTRSQKGALYPHGYLYIASSICTDSQAHTKDSVLTSPMPMFHVAALHIVANSALHAGCIAHVKSRFSASRFWQQCADDEATWAIVLGPMMAMIDKRTPDPIPAHRIKRIYCPPPPTNRAELQERFGIELLIQGFGMTEIYPMAMVSDRPDEVVPLDTLGRPPAWTDFGVVDDNDALLPPGERGEIVFRPRIPHAMMSGYFQNPEQTVEAFRNLMFHTGDLGYYDELGRLHYRGRKQERIRVKGEMVSAPELEYLALSHSEVLEAAAFGVPAELGEEDIKLDVRVTGELSAVELYEWLQEAAPRYMVPRYIELRDSFPKTPSERIEKYKLKAEGHDRLGVFDAAQPTVSAGLTSQPNA